MLKIAVCSFGSMSSIRGKSGAASVTSNEAESAEEETIWSESREETCCPWVLTESANAKSMMLLHVKRTALRMRSPPLLTPSGLGEQLLLNQRLLSGQGKT